MTKLQRYDAKRDDNEQEIVQALVWAGASVVRLSAKGVPDLLVGCDGQTYLLEVKTTKGDLTTDQVQFFSVWEGHAVIVRSIEDALRAIGR